VNEWSFSVRCAGVAREVVEAEAARLVADASSDDEISVAYAAGPPAVAELGVRDGGFAAAEVATRLGGLVWFAQEGSADRDVDRRALYFEGTLLFEVVFCELFDCDELEVGRGFLDELEPTLADLLEPSAWVMRVAAERFGDAFTRISSRLGLRADEHRTLAGTGPARGGGGGAHDQAEPADDDLPF
jgi:hypothetical protein